MIKRHAVNYIVGLLFSYSALLKILNSSAAEVAVATIITSTLLIKISVWFITAIEIYTAWALLTKQPNAYTIAQGLLGIFILFLCYLLTLANPPDCGCGSLISMFNDAKTNAQWGICRNFLLIGLLQYQRMRQIRL